MNVVKFFSSRQIHGEIIQHCYLQQYFILERTHTFLSFITFLDTRRILSTLPGAQEQGAKYNLYVLFSALIKSEDLTTELKILQCCHEVISLCQRFWDASLSEEGEQSTLYLQMTLERTVFFFVVLATFSGKACFNQNLLFCTLGKLKSMC